MREVPEDILAIADDIRHQRPTQDRIARAILAERKRCADAVRTVSLETFASPHHLAQLEQWRDAVAKAIEAGQ